MWLCGAIGLALVGMGKLNATETKNIRTKHAMFAYILGNAEPETTYPFSNLNGSAIEVWEWVSSLNLSNMGNK